MLKFSPDQAASSGVVAAAGVRVVREPAAGLLLGPEGAAGFDSPSFITGDFRDMVQRPRQTLPAHATVLSAGPLSQSLCA
jgi:hypothetical protein